MLLKRYKVDVTYVQFNKTEMMIKTEIKVKKND